MVKRDFTRLTPDEKINGIKASKLPDHIRSKYHGEDVREAIAQSTEMAIQLGINMGLSPGDALSWARKLQETVSPSEFDSWVATLLDGGPSIFMNTLSELNSNYPKGSAGVALVRETDPAKIYVWKGNAWEDFGDYQGVEIKDGSVTTKKYSVRSITGEKMVDVDVEVVSSNLFNKDDIIKDGYYDYDGTWRKGVNYVHSSNFIPVKPSTRYKRTGTTTGILWDKNKKLIKGFGDSEFMTTADTAYVTISFLVDTEADVKLMEYRAWKDYYVPYRETYTLGKNWKVEGKNLSLSDESILGTKLDDVKLGATSMSKNLFNKDDIIKDGYYDYDGKWRMGVNYVHSSNFIPVKPGTRYKRTGTTTGILWDKNKELISGFGDSVFTTNKDTAYVTISFPVDTEAVVKLMEYNDWTDDYVPYKGRYTLGESWTVESKNLSLSDGTILATKLDDVKLVVTSKNLFNKDDIINNGYYDYDGTWKMTVNYLHSSNFIPVKPGTQYKRTGATTGILWDKNKKLIRGFGDSVFTTTKDTAYVTISFLVDTEADVKLMEYNDWTDDYVPYTETYTLGESWKVEGKNLSLSDGSILATKLDDVKLEVTSKNLFNKDDIIKGGYYDYDGTWRMAVNYVDSSNFIPVKPSTRYKRTGTTAGIMWDKNKELTGGFGGSEFTTTNDTAYVTISFLVDTEADVKLMEYKDWTDNYVPFESKYAMGEKWLNGTSSKEAFSAFLRVPTPYVDGTDDPWSKHQTTHPSIVQFDEKWNGYKYWLAHTPFPHNNDSYENPCIAVSNNGVKWEEPTGVTNPLVPKPTGKGGFQDYNSDTCIFYNDTNDEIEIWYREVIRKKEPREEIENLKRITSSDGTNWSEPELMLSHSDPTSLADLIAPSIIYHEGVYKMWVMNHSKIGFMTSTDGKEWSEQVEVLTNGKSFTTWHPNVVLYNNKFHMFNTIYAGAVKYSTASLGSETSFSDEKTIISPTGNEWDLDGHRLYHAAPIFHKDSVMVIYGMVSYGNDYTLGLDSGLDFYHLETVPQKAYDFYGVEWWG